MGITYIVVVHINSHFPTMGRIMHKRLWSIQIYLIVYFVYFFIIFLHLSFSIISLVKGGAHLFVKLLSHNVMVNLFLCCFIPVGFTDCWVCDTAFGNAAHKTFRGYVLHGKINVTYFHHLHVWFYC